MLHRVPALKSCGSLSSPSMRFSSRAPSTSMGSLRLHLVEALRSCGSLSSPSMKAGRNGFGLYRGFGGSAAASRGSLKLHLVAALRSCGSLSSVWTLRTLSAGRSRGSLRLNAVKSCGSLSSSATSGCASSRPPYNLAPASGVDAEASGIVGASAGRGCRRP